MHTQRGAPVPGLYKRCSKRAAGRNWRTLPYGAKHDGGWPGTRGEGLHSARAREKRRAGRAVAEYADYPEWEGSEPHASDCCLCFDHGPECATCWPGRAAVLAKQLLRSGLPVVFSHWVVAHAATPGVLDQLDMWASERDPAERDAIMAYVQHLIEERSESHPCAS